MRKILVFASILVACASQPLGVPGIAVSGDTAQFAGDAGAVDGGATDAAKADAATVAVDSGADALAADGAVPVDTTLADSNTSDAADASDTGQVDSVVDSVVDSGVDSVVDSVVDNGLDPDLGPDTGPSSDGAAAKALGTLFAHTPSVLYRLDQAGFVQVGAFGFNKNGGQVTDIALDEDANLFAITFNDLFSCDSKTAQCKWLASLPQQFNGLTFVPEGVLGAKAELVGIANNGTWNHLQVQGATAKITQLGSYGGGYQSSGDAFSVEGVGTLATVTGGLFGGDKLAIVDAKTGAIKKVLGDTGVNGLWGLAWHADKIYGFSSDGQIVTLDPTTGKASPATGLKAPPGVTWWGAGVSTRAAMAN